MALRFYIGKNNDTYIENSLSTQKSIATKVAKKWENDHVKMAMREHPDVTANDWEIKFATLVTPINLQERNRLLETYGNKYLYTGITEEDKND